MSVKLYVAGVSWTTTDEAFRQFFEQQGAVEEVLIMREAPSGRSRGFGFVTFKDPAVADKVLAQELQLDGRKLDLKRAVPKTEMIQQVDETPSSKKLYVAGISFTATDDQVAAYFSRFGQVEKATIIKDKQASRSRGFGFVSFVEEGVVQDVLAAHNTNKLEWEGRTLELRPAVPRGANTLVSGASAGRNKKLFVAGLSPSTSDETLLEYFSKFGPVTEATVQKNRGTGEPRGFGFVTFQDASSVDRVLEQSHMLDNEPIACKLAVPKLQQPVFAMGVSSMGNNWTNNSSAWNTPTAQHFPVAASSAVSAFSRGGLDVRDVRNNLEAGGTFGGAYANQSSVYTDRFGQTAAVVTPSYSSSYGAASGLGGLGGLSGSSRLPNQGSYVASNFVSGVNGFDNSYDNGRAAYSAAPSYARAESNYYSDETSYGGYDRQRSRVAYHPYSR